MNECVLIAAPGGNPAPVVTLVWALQRQWGLRVASAHLLLYRSAEAYLHDELLTGAHPLEQLRRTMGDPELAQLNLHPVRGPGGGTIEDDATPEHEARWVESLWSLVRQVQADQPLPVVFGLIGGRRRTLAVDTAAVFQLLARPQDWLVDLRLVPKYADDPRSGFFFPEQDSPCEVVDLAGRVFAAHEVTVGLVEPRLPRLRCLLMERDRASFAHALEAGEAALERGPLPQLALDLRTRELRVNDLTIRLSADQMIWYATLAFARQQGEGWLDVQDTTLLARVVELCESFWLRGERLVSEAYDFSDEASAWRLQKLQSLRSRLRKKLNQALRGHPHRGLLVPEQRFTVGRASSVERLALDGGCIRVEPGLPSSP